MKKGYRPRVRVRSNSDSKKKINKKTKIQPVQNCLRAKVSLRAYVTLPYRKTV